MTNRLNYRWFACLWCLVMVYIMVFGNGAAGDVGKKRGMLGIGVKMADNGLTVTGTVPDSPGEQAGLVSGDRIVKIDGQATANRTLSDCLEQLGGTAGETVTLTIQRQGSEAAESFRVVLTRARILAVAHPVADEKLKQYREQMISVLEHNRPAQWNGNKITSRVLPYPDLVSVLIRLPIAHAAATGAGNRVAVIALTPHERIAAIMKIIAPQARIETFVHDPVRATLEDLYQRLGRSSCRIAIIPDVHKWPTGKILKLVEYLMTKNILPVIPSDFSEQANAIELINSLQRIGALTVGQLNWQLLVLRQRDHQYEAFNDHIKEIRTDVFAPAGYDPVHIPLYPVTTIAGIASLILENEPELKPVEIKEKILKGSRDVWQCRSVETGKWQQVYRIDPVTAQYYPDDERAIFRFKVADAAGALGVDTEISWPLNMLNCHKAWEIARGEGVVAAVSDSGFHINHPALRDKIMHKKSFGNKTFDTANQGFHGTDMILILLSVAPEVELIPLLSSGQPWDALSKNIIQAFEYAVEEQVDVVSASWAAGVNNNPKLHGTIRKVVDSGTVVSWFHYPESYPGVVRSKFVYAESSDEPFLGFCDRFLSQPGFYPAEIEMGLSRTAPQAAGIAALAKSANRLLNPKQIASLIKRHSTPIGSGILIPNAYAIVRSARDLAKR